MDRMSQNGFIQTKDTERLGLDARFWRTTAALTFLMFATSLMNGVVFPLFDPIFPTRATFPSPPTRAYS